MNDRFATFKRPNLQPANSGIFVFKISELGYYHLVLPSNLMTNIEFGRGTLDGSGCVSTAWEMIKLRYGFYLGMTLLTMVLTQWLYCMSWILIGPIWAGVYYVVSRDLEGEPIEFGMMFKGFDKFLPLMIIGLIQSIPMGLYQVLSLFFNFASMLIPNDRHGSPDFFQESPIAPAIGAGVVIAIIIGAFVFFLFFITWSVTFYFAIPLTYEYDLPPMEAIKLSARAGWSNFGGLVVITLMLWLVGILGVLLLCIGVLLVSVPVTIVAHAVAYRHVFPRIRQNMQNMMPPPPHVYGSSFGSGLT
jgi:uncharacterized membrane protein